MPGGSRRRRWPRRAWLALAAPSLLAGAWRFEALPLGGAAREAASAAPPPPPGAAFAAPAGAAIGEAGPDDLLIIGAGLLGRRVAAQWLEAHPSARVVGATLGESSHAALRELGVEPTTAEALRSRRPRPAFPRVLFAAPPRRGQGVDPGAYAVAVAEAAEYVAGSLVLTSSASVFAEDSGGAVREDSPVSAAPASQVLLGAERCALDAGGSVLRLAGLYDTDRGPHTYWLKVGKVSANPEGLINMLHYDDAAAAAVAALERGLRGEVLIVSDGSPLTRAEICRAAVGARPFRDEAVMPAFEASETGSPPPMGGKGNGKVLDASRAREVLRWSPRHASFASYMAAV